MRNGSAAVTLTEAFAQQVARHPDQVAAECPERRYTYRSLNEASDRIAAAIVAELGPGPEPVPIVVSQSSTSLAAMFGVLKAGKIYTTINPEEPQARRDAMLSILGARLILSDTARLDTGLPARLVTIDDAISSTAPDLPEVCAPSPEDLAWIIWTSGSTGIPKGVTTTHRIASEMCLDYAGLIGLTPEDRLSLYHPNLTWDIFGTLLSGAGIFPFDVRRYGIGTACDWAVSRRLTYFRAFPTTFRRMMEATGTRMFPSVRLLHLSGEAVSPSDRDSFQRHFTPGSQMMVLYGSSEGGMATAHFTPHGATDSSSRVSIGRPLEKVDLKVLNEQGEACQPGETGEIALRSPYVFPGYWQRPDLTQAAFLPGPERRFLTGDLARVWPGGQLEYVGRKDSQVKVRGHRIELAEIELALQKHPDIRGAVAKVFTGKNGEDRLAAYLLAPAGAPPHSELRRFLADHLPGHMHPDRFITLAQIPMTANGKADRGALPAPDRSRPDLDTPFEPPQPGLEQEIAQMFEDALEVEPVGAQDSFFALGGKSLAALRLLTRIAEKYSVSIAPRLFFESPTPLTTALHILGGAVDSASDEELARMWKELEALGDQA